MINFTELYYNQVDNLFAFGSKFSSDRELIKDCIQDVFVKLFAKRNELTQVTNIESYLYASLRNRINDEFRRNTHLCDNEITDQNYTPNNEKFDAMEKAELQAEDQKKVLAVAQYVKQLPPRQQQIINLYYIEERKYDDICQIMGINYQSVRNLMHRSLIKLRGLAAKSEAI